MSTRIKANTASPSRHTSVSRFQLAVVLSLLAVESTFASGRYNDLDNVPPGLYALGREIWLNVGGVWLPWIALFVVALPLVLRPITARHGLAAIHLSLLGAAVLVILWAHQGTRNFAQGVLPFVTVFVVAHLIGHVTTTEAGRKSLERGLIAVNAATIARAPIVLFFSSSERFVPFYDGIAIIVSGACVTGSLARSKPQRSVLFWVSLTAFLLSGSIGSRRAALLAVLAAMIVVALLHRGAARWRIGATIALAFVALLFSAGDRMRQGFNALVNNAGERSTTQHVSDVEYGWYLCQTRASFLSGLGPTAPQVNGLASNEGLSLYIHSEYWQVCVGSGHLALILLIIGLTVALILAMVRLRKERYANSTFFLVGASVVIALPVVAIWFPYLTTTPRWPVLAGVALGLLGLTERSTAGKEAELHEDALDMLDPAAPRASG